MKQIGLLNQPLSHLIAGMGHMDELCVADAGLPIPSGVARVDLAISRNLPPFLEVVRAVLSELRIESAIIAEEMSQRSPETEKALRTILGDVAIQVIPHDSFKARTRQSVAVVRTGEFTPYANVILVAGVVF
jgi:D-ribose pyranase